MADSEAAKFNTLSVVGQWSPEAQEAFAALDFDGKHEFRLRIIDALNSASNRVFEGVDSPAQAVEDVESGVSQWLQFAPDQVEKIKRVEQEPLAKILEEDIKAKLEAAEETITNESPMGITGKDAIDELSDEALDAYKQLTDDAKYNLKELLGFIDIANEMIQAGYETREEVLEEMAKHLAKWRRLLAGKSSEDKVTVSQVPQKQIVAKAVRDWLAKSLEQPSQLKDAPPRKQLGN